MSLNIHLITCCLTTTWSVWLRSDGESYLIYVVLNVLQYNCASTQYTVTTENTHNTKLFTSHHYNTSLRNTAYLYLETTDCGDWKY